MSYPNYPYQQGAPGQPKNNYPEHATVGLSYPVPGYPSAPTNAAYPLNPSPYGLNSAHSPYPSNPAPYPSNPAPYPSNPSPYPSNPSPYPSNPAPYPSAQSAYPSNPAPYPSNPAPYPSSQPSYPSNQAPYPSNSAPYPSNPSNPSPYPPSNPAAAPYPSNPYGSSHNSANFNPSPRNPLPYPSNQSSHGPNQAYPTQNQTHQFNPPAKLYPTHNSGPANQLHNQYAKSGTPTVRPAVPFDPRQDAEVLRKAMKGIGTDEKAIIKVLANRTNIQRQEIAVNFKSLFGKDLLSDLKSELSGKFEDLVKALMTPLSEFLAKELHYAMEGVGTTEETIVEIICTASNAEIHAIKFAYERKYKKSLESDLQGETSGSFRRLLTSLCQGNRIENAIVDHQAAFQDAQNLLRAGEMRLGTDESTFNAILSSRSYPQLHQVFAEYQRLTGHEIDKAIKNEFSGDIQDGLLAIVHSVRDKYGFFAERLYNSMTGAGTRDRALIRIVVSRSEIDLYDIKNAFQSRYGKTLETFIEDDTSGDYKKCLLSLVSP